ncbi:MAG: Flp pilus assembly complex ATPase component TadA [Desulfobacteraceae bacterium]|nr:Flp pilus assembly complex ATPase component TadA [Desulfobacteraceae bacterium]
MNSLAKPLILCIDDDQDMLRLIERFLAGSGYNVITADSGLKGLEIVSQAKPNLILLDIKMPGMDGYEVCSRLSESGETSYIPVIFVTALGEEQDRARAFAVGAADYLVKPIQKDILTGKIRTHIKTGVQWKKLQEDAGTWYKRVLPASFIKFKEFLFDKLNLNPEERYKFSSVSISRIYSISSDAGIDESSMAKYIAEFLKLPYIPRINPEDVQLGVLPTTFCRSNHVVAVSDVSAKKTFVLSNPFDQNLSDTLMKFSGLDKTSRLTITAPANIDSLFEHDKSVQVKTVSAVGEKVKTEGLAVETVAELSESETKKHTIVRIANTIISTAVSERASDVHIEPKEIDTVVRFRIDGDLREMFRLKKDTGVKLISRYKVLGGLDIAEKKKPQDGVFAAIINKKTFNLRLSTTSTPSGESFVMRLLQPHTRPKELTELGMTDKQVNALIHAASRSTGMILIVGGTGSGKTTTIYSLLSKVDCETRSLMSVEDPVEYRIPLANQQQVNEKAGVTFDSLLKAAVRQDPDILFMGEVRDNYSAKMAIDFASTGHLTITTLHTSNATTAIFRLERLGIDRRIMADTTLAVVAQRLLKKLCPHCKEIVSISPEEAEMLSSCTDDIPSRVAHPVGCPECNDTGYYDREGVYEVLSFDPEISEMVRAGASITEIRTLVHERGDYLVADHALEKMRNHIFAPKDIYEKILVEEIDFRKSPRKKTLPEAAPPEEKTESQSSILIVEDDEDTRRLITRFLENRGYKITVSKDGIDAIFCLGKEDFDLILSDVDMPNLDGFKLLEMVSQKGIKAPVIFLTSRADPRDEERGFMLGAMDYIKKPIQKEILLLRVKRVLDGARKQE